MKSTLFQEKNVDFGKSELKKLPTCFRSHSKFANANTSIIFPHFKRHLNSLSTFSQASSFTMARLARVTMTPPPGFP